MCRLVTLLVALGWELLLAVSVASAQARPPDLDRGFYVTALYGTNRDLFSLAEPFVQGLGLAGFRDIRIDFEPADRPVVGISAAGHLSRYVVASAEFLYNDLGESLVSGRFGSSPRANITMHARFIELTTGIRTQLPAGTWRIRPYVGGGGGFVRLSIDAEGPGTSVSQNANDYVYYFDVGTQVFVTKTFGVGPELRVMHLPDGDFYRILIGAIFRFGRSQHAPDFNAKTGS